MTTDRREPVARRLLQRIENDFAPHVVERIDAMLTAELARTDDTHDLSLELPDSHGAKLFVRGFPPTLRQRVGKLLRSQ